MDPELVELSSDGARVRINPEGAELYALEDAAGRSFLWNGDPAFWSFRAPLLFPIIGVLNGGSYRLGTDRYALEKHGFARRSRFEVIERNAGSALFRLEDSDRTRLVYPFRFRLDVRFALEGARLDLEATIFNRDARPLPASFGFHPALLWPPPGGARETTELVFETDEPEDVRQVDASGLFKPQRSPTPVEGRRLRLRDDLFTVDAVIFDHPESSSVILQSPGSARVRVSFPDTPFLGVWSKPGAGFVCVEAWHGHADPEGWTGDFYEKPASFTVAPEASRTLRLGLELLAD